MTATAMSRLGIVGAGTMGTCIAYRCAVSGAETFLYDKYPDVLERSPHAIEGWLAQRVKSGVLGPDEAQAALSRVHACQTLAECVADFPLVIENVHEDL